MALFDQSHTGGALEDLFDRERDAILTGRFDVLERLAREKERLLKGLRPDQESADHLMRLRRMSGRNHDLLASMQRGVRAAAKRLQQLSGAQADLRTYDAAGGRQTIAATRHELQRRA